MPGVGSNPNWPDLRVYVDFTNPGANGTYTWTEITQWCRRHGTGQLAHIERGRNYERAQTDSATCTLIVDNSTGVFDPENAASPYYPNVKPIRKIKVESAWQVDNLLAPGTFEAGTTGGWNAFAGCSIANSTAIAHTGTHSLAVTIPTANLTNFCAYSPYETRYTVPGRTYTASIWVWSNTAFTGAARFQHDNYAGTAVLSFELGTSTAVSANTWTQLTVTGVIPAGGGRDRVELYLSANSAGQVIYIDDAVISGYGVYPLFQGRVEDWPRTWTKSGFYGEVAITARGILSSLSTITLQAPWVNAAITDGAEAIYRLNDASGSVSAANYGSTSQQYATIVASPSCTSASQYGFGGPIGLGNLAGDPTTSLNLTPETSTNNRAGYYLKVATNADSSRGLILPAAGGWSWEGWINPGTIQPVAPRYILSQVSNDASGYIQVLIEILGGSNHVDFEVNGQGAGISAATNTAINVCDGGWHHIVLTFGADGKTGTLYVDGNSVSNVSSVPIVYNGVGSLLNVGGQGNTVLDAGGYGCWKGALKDLAWYNTVLTGTQVNAHRDAGKGYPGDDTGTRIWRILSYAPYALQALDIGNSLVSAMHVEGVNAVQAMQNVNDTEVGTLWETGDGYVRFTSRHGRGGAAAAAVFGEAGYPYEEGLTIQQDPREIYSTVIVSVQDGPTITNTDVSATQDFFPRTLNIQSEDYTTAQAVDLSNYQLNRYKAPRSRIPNLTLRPSANPALWPQALGREIGDRVTVTRNNPGAPSISGDFYIEKITHDIAVGEWRVSYMLSSASLFDYWILGDSTFGVLGSTTQLSF